MANAEEGIIISVKGLCNENNCPTISYIRNPQNNANAATAYCSFFRPVFRYAEIDKAVNIAENMEATKYNESSITLLIRICCTSSVIMCMPFFILES